ncbi:glycoside hydrolase family 3 C-terminal domain-containing protein [Saccharibacillus sp. CPCC 101409]|uniref:glycoside hydrolase family 3 C-terminal domain-containing protein n=1 Tax=Saccharibacillus sp. CPCC 101409 TaxID=3058041 RepID=UPI0026719C4A|nr:glycoside hydrolase family 3 C-terminal domain-containing protein [Saccharibacillus sp. CPCC 101409]MDO3410125.1 glycoside hydrolase family 3 C-terminal domain-containing protein [Saccharibacillus sp. CPCC 101409]
MTSLTENRDKIQTHKQKAGQLVAQMTLKEKIHQMVHAAPAIERLDVKAYNWWNEGLHGVARAGTATIFPQAIGLAATFDEDLLEEVADAIATETRSKFNMQQRYGDTDIYKGLTLWAPNVNIFRDPRWGRGHETYGEDPHLTARLAVRFINGLQGDDENYLKTAACAKHFAVHSGPEDIRHSFNAVVSDRDLHETYLPAFKACVQEARVEAVMGAYNRTNDEPCCGSELLLEQILRGAWGFDGHVVSDCWAIRDFHLHHKVTANEVESVALAVKHGCDLNCGSLFLFLEAAIEQGLVTEKQIDTAVTRLFTTRMKLGLFDDPADVPFSSIGYTETDSPAMKELNLKAARESLVLLKNDGLLPLDKSKVRTVGVIGPNANNRRALVGNYEGTASRYVTPLEGIQDYLGDDARVLYSEGCHLFQDKVGGLAAAGDRSAEARGVCAESDVVIVCLGLDSGLEGEEGDMGNAFASGDKPDLKLPGMQEELLRIAHESGKPVILALLSGSALAVNYADEHIPAVIQAWYPGAQGGRALAEAIFGDISPSGKLPVTFYRTSEELPAFTDYSMKNRTYRYMSGEALYPFGFGLTYGEVEIEAAALDTDRVTQSGVAASIRLVNRGDRACREIVQAYVKADRAGTPNPQLKAFRSVELEAGSSAEIELILPFEAFALCGFDGSSSVETGSYTVHIGTSQPDRRSAELTGQTPKAFTLQAEA